jgi:hypothetical protein
VLLDRLQALKGRDTPRAAVCPQKTWTTTILARRHGTPGLVVSPFQGCVDRGVLSTQGVALGFHIAPLRGEDNRQIGDQPVVAFRRSFVVHRES